MTYSCPLCHLRFRYAAELDGHARDEHQPLLTDEVHEHLIRYRDDRAPTRYVTPSM